MPRTSDKKERLISAAKTLIHTQGFGATSLADIAEASDVPLGNVYYYFRSKDKLFNAVFKESFFKLLPNLVDLLKSDITLFEKIRLFVESYIDIINANPLLPSFIIHELGRNPEAVAEMIKSSGINPEYFVNQVQEEIKNGSIEPVKPLHLIVNMLAMCIFPFVAKPILQDVIFHQDQQQFDIFIQERKKEVSDFIINSIKKK